MTRVSSGLPLQSRSWLSCSKNLPPLSVSRPAMARNSPLARSRFGQGRRPLLGGKSGAGEDDRRRESLFAAVVGLQTGNGAKCSVGSSPIPAGSATPARRKERGRRRRVPPRISLCRRCRSPDRQWRGILRLLDPDSGRVGDPCSAGRLDGSACPSSGHRPVVLDSRFFVASYEEMCDITHRRAGQLLPALVSQVTDFVLFAAARRGILALGHFGFLTF
jgi:hypothetical protein